MKESDSYLFELFWEKWVVMDSNHRRHSQQIYSLPHLATLVTTQSLLVAYRLDTEEKLRSGFPFV